VPEITKISLIATRIIGETVSSEQMTLFTHVRMCIIKMHGNQFEECIKKFFFCLVFKYYFCGKVSLKKIFSFYANSKAEEK
jgi:hypothetical protein